jgi:hypothetical protein
MKVSIVQDAIIFVSSLTKEEFEKASRFCPESLTLMKQVGDDKKKEPICAIAYAGNGDVSNNGIIFDSVTEEGKICLTLAASTGHNVALTAEEKKQVITEQYASLILNVNELEAQIKAALAAKDEQINTALESVETVSL